eukprot:CAMPEP_0202884994 /NCGR_PEP_ID=MMETSP1391-20130828/41436_1 /ASSEMBLY_ACC=CAM_ASM_000867 /TAXON_ID=1034604 /ORGANISM="Chlamydomonas leiostraca, Strain SAG 11-49" /LENGTH=138 /DNA_ID=CAMNT_0049568229 /DNA_START=892 /DNA_END=1305 /DNA_ORIENTATION=-
MGVRVERGAPAAPPPPPAALLHVKPVPVNSGPQLHPVLPGTQEPLLTPHMDAPPPLLPVLPPTPPPLPLLLLPPAVVVVPHEIQGVTHREVLPAPALPPPALPPPAPVPAAPWLPVTPSSGCVGSSGTRLLALARGLP